jgi:hypothetical protein
MKQLPPRNGIYLELTAILSDGRLLTVAVDSAVLVDDHEEAWRKGFEPAIRALKKKLESHGLEPFCLPSIVVMPKVGG